MDKKDLQKIIDNPEVAPQILTDEQKGDVLKTFARKADEKLGAQIAMILVNEDKTKMTSKEFLDVVNSDGMLFHNMTNGGKEDVLPQKITLRCGCVYMLTAKGWPTDTLVCQHGNVFVKMN